MATQLIRMVRDEHYGKPYSADVHPAEVENYKRGGFRVVEEIHEKQEDLQAPQAAQAEEVSAGEQIATLDAQIVALHSEGKNTREIAAAVGVSWQKVISTLKKYE